MVVTDEGELIAGRYRIASRLGAGAMGVVWQANDDLLHRTVAVKQLLLRWETSEAQATEGNRRAMREARITARLHHPHAVTVYDVVEHDGKPCLVMEYFRSRSLAATIAERGGLPATEVAGIGRQIASALAAAHEVGIVHRDIKPGNVLLAADGTAKITDFGISRAIGDGTVTPSGVLAGTPAYLAPEVAQGEDAGFPADVFSLGSTLYAAVEGAPPFGLHDNAMALLYRIATQEVPEPTRAGPLAPVLAALLARDPSQRPGMRDALRALGEVAESRPSTVPVPGAIEVSRPPAPPEADTSPPPAVAPERWVTSPPGPSAEPPGHAGVEPPAEPEPPPRAEPRAGALDAVLSAAAAPAGPDAAGGGPPRDGDDRRPRRLAIMVAVVAMALVTAGVLVAVALNDGQVTRGRAVGTSSAPSAGASPPPPQPASTVASTSDAGGAPTTAPGEAPGATPTATPPPAPPDTATQLRAAIVDYYALMPGNLSEGWNRMTADYQTNHAGGFSGYQSFWNPIDRVALLNVTATPPASVDATIDYFYRDGHVVEEQTSFGMVLQDGQWKIASSTVSSSRNR
jgi:hypothetical protein